MTRDAVGAKVVVFSVRRDACWYSYEQERKYGKHPLKLSHGGEDCRGGCPFSPKQ